MYPRTRAFTLIELLIVVAIIAILAAIAVPNFLEAQVRSKVSRTKADMRSMTTAIEAYRVDNTRYPPDRYDVVPPSSVPWEWVLKVCTTPIAYITSIPPDVFVQQNKEYGTNTWYLTKTGYARNRHYPPNEAGFFYGPRDRYVWALISPAPDLYWEFDRDPASIYTEAHLLPWVGDVLYYDPTNGTLSQGDLYAYGPGNDLNPAPSPPAVP